MYDVSDQRPHRHALAPTTRLGKWAVAFGAASVVLSIAWTLMGPLGGFPGLVCGLAGGAFALIAILRGERAVLVYLTLVLFANALFFVAGSLLLG